MAANVPEEHTASMLGVDERMVLRKIGTRYPPTRTQYCDKWRFRTHRFPTATRYNIVTSVVTRCTEVLAITSYYTRRNNGTTW